MAVCGLLTSERPLSKAHHKIKTDRKGRFYFMVGEAGFGPAKSVTTDLQSAPFGRSGIPPYSIAVEKQGGAGGRI